MGASMFWLSIDYRQMEREFRLTQLKLDEQNALLIREGLKDPSDDVLGPTNYMNPATENDQ